MEKQMNGLKDFVEEARKMIQEQTSYGDNPRIDAKLSCTYDSFLSPEYSWEVILKVSSSFDWDDMIAHGETVEEAIQDAKKELIEMIEQYKDGKFVVRYQRAIDHPPLVSEFSHYDEAKRFQSSLESENAIFADIMTKLKYNRQHGKIAS